MQGYKLSLSTSLKYLIYLYIFIIVISRSTGTTAVRAIRVLLMLFYIVYIIKNKLRLSGYMKWAIVFLLYNAAMIPFALYRNEAKSYTGTLAYVLVANIIIYTYLKDHNIILGMANVFIASTIFKALTTFGRYGILVFLTSRRTDEGSANTLAFYASMSFIFCIILQRAYYKRSIQYLYIIAAAVCLLVTVLCGSRKSVVFIFVPLVVYLILSSRNPIKTFRNILIAAASAVGLYFALLKVPFIYRILGSRVESMINGFMGNSTDASTATRLRLIDAGIDWFIQRPWFGYGMNGYGALNWNIRRSIYYSHNNYIELLVNCGIIGTCIYYSIYINILRHIARNNGLGRKASAILTGIIMCFFISDYGMVSYNFVLYQLILMCVYMVAAGMIQYKSPGAEYL